MRKLASIQKVLEISPIKDADAIECVHVLGWTVVAQKGEFAVGDDCVYFEVDSFLPDEDKRYEFLIKSSYRNNEFMGHGLRIKTAKLRGQISQGIVMPLSEFPEIRSDTPVGTDVSELLRVRKWDMPEQDTGMGTAVGGYLDGIEKTDETRIQSAPELISEFRAAGEYYISTKMDGTSCTFAYDGEKVRVCGHNREFKDTPASSMWNFVHSHGIDKSLQAYGQRIAIQGEFCGPGIQKNPLMLDGNEFYAFTLIDMQTGKRLGLDRLLEACSAIGLEHVPIEERGKRFDYADEQELLARAEGKYASGNNKEGIVIRPVETIYSNTLGGPLSMKVINNVFLLKEEG